MTGFDPTLAAHLELASIGEGEFDVPTPLVSNGRLLGSGLLAASTLAARRTVGGDFRPVASSTTFARAGDPTSPVRLTVTPVHHGRSVVVVGVRAAQGERSLSIGTVRFHDEHDVGFGGDWPAAVLAVTPAAELCRAQDAAVSALDVLAGFDVRGAIDPATTAGPVMHPFWARPRQPLPLGPGVHEAVVAFLSDIAVTVSADASGRSVRDRRANVSLDHSLWWHRAPRADTWLMIEAEPQAAHAGRALARGTVRDQEGRLVASFAQEVLLRTPT